MQMSILWIEDERNGIERFVEMLKEEVDCSIVFSSDGADAIQRLCDSDFDFIILDIMMPTGEGMPTRVTPKRAGIELLRMIRNGEIKDQKVDKDIPVIAFTAVSNEVDQEMIIELSVSDYLLKPVSFKTLLNAVEKVLSSLGTHKRGGKYVD